jgi:hypothetical protein
MQNTPDPGSWKAVYQTHRLRFSNLGGLLFCGIFVVVLPFALGLTRLYNGYTRYGPAAGFAWGTPWLAFAVLAFFAWLVLLVRKLQFPHYKIQVNKNGLQFEGYRAAQKVLGLGNTLSWDMFSGITVETIGKKIRNDPQGNEISSLKVALLLSDGKKINLFESGDRRGGLKNLSELVSRIKANLYPRLMQKYNSAFSAGQVLTFGPVSVQRQELRIQIHHRGKYSSSIPWDQVRHITVKSGYLVVELIQSPDPVQYQRRFPVSQIPNLELLLQIIKENVEG